MDSANNGDTGTLGMVGDTGKVACASCHVPASGFLDSRSTREQISLAAGWTHRRAPSLLDVSQSTFLTWDGRHDAPFNQVFGPFESPVEFNSSRLFIAQQVERLYKDSYEAIFGPLPDLSQFQALDAALAGCTSLPNDIINGSCPHVGADNDDVTRVVVNVGKAIEAYERKLTCGQSRFDQFMAGDKTAMSAQEQLGASLFVSKGACDACHSGPYLSDHQFHNIGVAPAEVALFFIDSSDPGASVGLPALLSDKLNSKGAFSDGYDGRLDNIPSDPSSMIGTFKTPSLRCVGRRPSYMHTGQYRSLEDVVGFFNRGGGTSGYLGTKDNHARNFTDDESTALVAFLRALDGVALDPTVVDPPQLPQ